tara:strand:- start:7470 stop:7787 length:318 start_codon:yes stop_codon:yes gene_type:complete
MAVAMVALLPAHSLAHTVLEQAVPEGTVVMAVMAVAVEPPPLMVAQVLAVAQVVAGKVVAILTQVLAVALIYLVKALAELVDYLWEAAPMMVASALEALAARMER